MSTSANPARRALTASSVGTFIEFYDFAIYGYTAVYIAKLFFPAEDAYASLLSALAVYGLAFVARPLGGIFFGRIGDRIGRKQVLMIVLLLVGVSTALIGCLPTFDSIGYLAPTLLVLLRLVQGFSAGGEAVGAISLAYEHAPANRRGFYATTTIAVGAVPSVFSALIVLLISSVMSDDAFSSWGWRIPFWIALPLCLFALWVRSRTQESDEFLEQAKAAGDERPRLGQVLGRNWRNIGWVILIAGLSSLGYYLLVGYLVPYSQVVLKLDAHTALIANAIALGVYAIMLSLAGLLGDLYGRKKIMVIGAVLVAALSIPAFLLVKTGTFGGAIGGQVLLSLTIPLIGAATYPYAVELFPTLGRYTAGAIGYNVGFALFGGTAPYVSQAIIGATGFTLTPAFLVGGFAVLVLLLSPWIPNSEQARRRYESSSSEKATV
ncbi:MFS transporter [Actinoplanes bogorensis]|uniref:MFS transporter n=1 Tax=Paractinoplanes bogorensis TaxID=1610840 RepID=A0ABS5YYC1_9ACTN|nr:MFS transporter [Actinoplanes bogorensis]MBU2668076.1 MFS transporter [Actinoplanes bogorensis]